MKRKIGFLFLLLGLVAVVIVGIKLLIGRTPKTGILKVQSTPPASIFLNDKHLGRTPFEDKVSAGEYTFKLTPESTITTPSGWQGQITIYPNALTYVNRDLSDSELTSAGEIVWLEKISSRLGEISITSNPDAATVLLNNETKGTTPTLLTDITTGDYTVTLTSLGFMDRSFKIRVNPGYKVNASVQLALSSGNEIQPTPTSIDELNPTTKTTPAPTKTATSSAQIPDPPKPFVIIQDTPTGFLRVREESNTSAKELGRVLPGEKYTYFNSASTSGTLWYQIKYDGTTPGWVSSQYTKNVE